MTSVLPNVWLCYFAIYMEHPMGLAIHNKGNAGQSVMCR